MRTDILERKEEILQWISENQSKAYICKQLRCKPETLENYLNKMEIFYKGNQSGKGIKTSPAYILAEEYVKKTTYISSQKLKEKLLREEIKENKCEQCGSIEWQNQQIPLELHHVDGNHNNNNFDNLSLLCPNCHALQPVTAGPKSKIEYVSDEILVAALKESPNIRQALLKVGLNATGANYIRPRKLILEYNISHLQ